VFDFLFEGLLRFMAKRYGFDTEYSYNIFDADEHFDVNLWVMTDNGSWKRVDYWSYACGIFEFQRSIAHARAAKKIKTLRALYDAEPI